MAEAVESGRGRWTTAIGLTFAVLSFSVFDPIALVVLPLGVLLVALPARGKLVWVAAGLLLLAITLLVASGTLPLVSRGWGLMIGGLFLVVTLTRPGWPVVSRGLLTVTIALLVGGAGLFASGRASELDDIVRRHLSSALSVVLQDLRGQAADPEQFANVVATVERVTGDVFPALLVLQSLAALALAAWWARRVGRTDSPAFKLARLRDFRFSDDLIWVLIASVVVLLLPLGDIWNRVALNGLVVMASLYALRGLAVFVFLATGSRSIVTMVLGALALVFLYPVALTAALLMGVGDTWLDVRRRVASASPTG